MAQYQVKPPEPFSFKAEEWTKWIKRFDRFRIASGMDAQDEENQVNALIYTMGEQEEQEVGESADSFHTALHCLAEYCGYGALHDEMVRDCLVVGLRDKRLSEQLQMEPELTLEKAINKARQSEQVKKQLEMLKTNFKAEASSTQLDSMQSWQRSGSKQSMQRDRQTFHKKTLERQTQCNRCVDT